MIPNKIRQLDIDGWLDVEFLTAGCQRRNSRSFVAEKIFCDRGFSPWSNTKLRLLLAVAEKEEVINNLVVVRKEMKTMLISEIGEEAIEYLHKDLPTCCSALR